MRTYKKAGKVDLYLCGKYIASLDALYRNYARVKVSMMEVATFIISKHTCDVKNVSDIITYGRIDFVHRYLYLRNLTGHYPQLKEYNHRTIHQKFKLIGVELCQV